MTPRAVLKHGVTVLLLATFGCGSREIETTYGRMRDKSINGTGVLAEMFRKQGHTVRSTGQLTKTVSDWADVIVRFAPYPGPPDKEEADWYARWFSEVGERQMIYVARDYDALADYWRQVLDQLPKQGAQAQRVVAEKAITEAVNRAAESRARPKHVAAPEDWFAVETNRPSEVTSKTLDGEWSEGIDVDQAKIPRHEALKVDAEVVLLAGDEEPLVISWTTPNDGEILIVANGSFLLNGSLLNRARRPLAMRTVEWIGSEPLHVAFVEGRSPLADRPSNPSVFTLLTIWPFGWVVAQLMVLGLAACLARAPRLGRPRSEPESGEDRPVAHPEALGSLLARTSQATDARAILETYRRWRNPSSQTRVSPLPASAVSIENPFPTESLEHE